MFMPSTDHFVGVSSIAGRTQNTPLPYSSREWTSRVHDYLRLRMISDALPDDAENADDALEAYCHVRDRLMVTPAPDRAAVLWKLEQHREHSDLWTLSGEDWDLLIDDVTNMGFALSPTISENLETWLARSQAIREERSPADDIMNPLVAAQCDASKAVAYTPSQTIEDLLTKLYLLAVIKCEQDGPGPLAFHPSESEEGYEETHLWRGIIADLPQMSRVVHRLSSLPAPRGAHARVKCERHLWSRLPDLSSGRTLEDAVEHLNKTRKSGASHYAREWSLELEDFGCSVGAITRRRGEEAGLTIGLPCDPQMDERRRRMDALIDHLDATPGARDALLEVAREKRAGGVA